MTDPIAIQQQPALRRRKRPGTTTGVPYAGATTGERARTEITKIPRRLGCESIGFLEQFEKHEVLLYFKHRGREVQLRASAKGWAQLVRRHVGQPIVVENRTGAGGTVGMDAAMRSPSDGYIVLVPEVRAQEPAWPNRPVHFIVPLAPGGGIDFVARAVGAYDSAGRRSFRLPFQLAGFSPFRYSWALHQSNTLLNPLAQPQRQFGLL
jgi:hypothetical protein